MTNRWAVLVAGVVLSAGQALADSPRPPSYPGPMSMAGPQQFTVQDAFQQTFAMGVTTGQQVESRIRDMQKQMEDLRAYAVACGDKPGCFVPAPEK